MIGHKMGPASAANTPGPWHQPVREVNAMVSFVSPGTTVKIDCKPLAAVSVQACFVGGATCEDVIHGAAILSVTDIATGLETTYWCEALFYREMIVGWR